MLETVTFDLKDLAYSSLKLLICEPENLLELGFSRLIRAFKPHSFKLNSDSSLRLEPIEAVAAMFMGTGTLILWMIQFNSNKLLASGS